MTREEAIRKLQKQKAEYLEEWVDFSGVAEAFDMAIEALSADVVRCKDCKWFDPPHIEHPDGTRTDVEEGAPMVTIYVGIKCGGQCIHHTGIKTYCTNHDREDPDDYENIVIFRSPDDFCSMGERREE